MVPSGPNQGKRVICCLDCGDAKDCPIYTHNGTKAFIRHSHKGNEAQWDLVLHAINQGLSCADARGSDGPRLGPAHHIFRGWAAARPGPSNSNFSRPGPVHDILYFSGPAWPMTFAARSMRYGLYMGLPAIPVGRPVNLKGRPMYYPVLKGERSRFSFPGIFFTVIW